jgi:hypothetical protein
MDVRLAEGVGPVRIAEGPQEVDRLTDVRNFDLGQ